MIDGAAAREGASAFAMALRTVFPWLFLALLFGAWRSARPRAFLGALVLAQAWAWAATNLPLPGMYALGASSDRAGNLQLVQVVAAGGPWYESAQIGHYTFEPGWGLLVAALSGFDPDRVLAIYPWFALATAALFLVGVGLGVGRGSGEPWAGVMAAAFASLLASSPVDFAEHFRNPWAMVFLLKPNHAIGLVAAPLFFWALARARTPWRAALVGGVLGVAGWLNIFDMVLIWAGLCVASAATLVAPPTSVERGPLWPALAALAASAVVAAPYVYVLLFRFPAGEPGPRFGIPPGEAWFLWTTTQAGPLLPLAGLGLVWMRRRDRDLYRQWAAALVGAWLFWALLFGLGLVDRARERDEVFYWIRFLTTILAGVGAWAALERGVDLLPQAARPPHTRATLALAAMLPFGLPSWWDPARMDRYFLPSAEPLRQSLSGTGDFLRHQTQPRDAVAGDPSFMRYVGALGARRSLYSDNLNSTRSERARLEALNEALVRGGDPAGCRQARSLGVRYLVVTRTYLVKLGLTLDSLASRADLAARHVSRDPDGAFSAVFEILDCPRDGT